MAIQIGYKLYAVTYNPGEVKTLLATISQDWSTVEVEVGNEIELGANQAIVEKNLTPGVTYKRYLTPWIYDYGEGTGIYTLNVQTADLPAPTNVSASSDAYHSLALAWDYAYANEINGYRIYSSDGAATPTLTLLATVSADFTTKTINYAGTNTLRIDGTLVEGRCALSENDGIILDAYPRTTAYTSIEPTHIRVIKPYDDWGEGGVVTASTTTKLFTSDQINPEVTINSHTNIEYNKNIEENIFEISMDDNELNIGARTLDIDTNYSQEILFRVLEINSDIFEGQVNYYAPVEETPEFRINTYSLYSKDNPIHQQFYSKFIGDVTPQVLLKASIEIRAINSNITSNNKIEESIIRVDVKAKSKICATVINRNVVSRSDWNGIYRNIYNGISIMRMIHYCKSTYGELINEEIYRLNTKGIMSLSIGSFKTNIISPRFYSAMLVSDQSWEKPSQIHSTISNVAKVKYPLNQRIWKTTRTNMPPIIIKSGGQRTFGVPGSMVTILTTRQIFRIDFDLEITKVRIVCVGDSITAGHNPATGEVGYDPFVGGNPESSYPHHLQLKLGNDYQVINTGTGRDNTAQVYSRFTKDVLAYNPAYVIILIGTNDIFYGGHVPPFIPPEQILDEENGHIKPYVKLMIEDCLAQGARPILGLMLPRDEIKGEYKQALWDYNNWLRNTAKKYEIDVVDWYSIFDAAVYGRPGDFNPEYTADGTHPNIKGYKRMADIINIGIFTNFKTDIKLFEDAAATKEEPLIRGKYELVMPRIKHGQTRAFSKYIKNTGNVTGIFKMNTYYKNAMLSIDGGITWNKSVQSVIYPGQITELKIKVYAPRSVSSVTVDNDLLFRSYTTT